jgi:hypothetical protein
VEYVKEKVLEYLEQLYQNHPPEFVYYKTLFHLFEKFLADSGKTDIDLGQATLLESKIWKSLFDFQKDGVKGAINKIIKYYPIRFAHTIYNLLIDLFDRLVKKNTSTLKPNFDAF